MNVIAQLEFELAYFESAVNHVSRCATGVSPIISIFTFFCLLFIIIILFCSFESFFKQHYQMVSHWSLSDSKFPHVSRTLLSILADLKNDIVWMVPTRSLIFKSYSPWTYPLVTAASVPITIGIMVIFMIHSFFSSLERSRYSSLFSLSFQCHKDQLS